MDFTYFYGFVKKMVQKNQYTYNFPPGPSANPYLRGAKRRVIKILSKILNFYTHQKKSHVPALILKFLTTTPNLTSNFELVIRLFEKSKMFYPPEGLCRAEP